MQVVKLSPKHTELLLTFCTKCGHAGYSNNSSLESMKWNGNYDLPDKARFWSLMINNEIVGVSGVHKFGEEKLRCLFRSAVLPQFQNLVPGISRNHMNSIPFSILMPYQISWGIQNNYKQFYISTSHGPHDVSGKMSRTHKALSLLSKRNLVSFSSEEIIYNVPQTVWHLNLYKYLEVLTTFENTRQSLQIEENYNDAVSVIRDFLKCQ